MIPRTKICDNHDAPFDFVYHAFMGTYTYILGLANRSGGKTYDFSIISILNSLANDECESANLAAIQPQAQRCYRYMQKFIRENDKFRGMINGEPTMSRTLWSNGSSNEVLTATISGVNSPHPQKLIADEIELIPWVVLQQMFSMVQGKNGIKGTMVLGSTRKFSQGPMQRLINQGGLKLFSWCIWEVVEPLPVSDPVFLKEIKEAFGEKLPKNIHNADGFYQWEDLVNRFRLMDLDTWEAEWECQRPQSQGLVYPRYDDNLNIDNEFVLDPDFKDIFIFEDFGYSKDHPDVILFTQVDWVKGTLTVFDELYSHLMGTDDILSLAYDRLREHGLMPEQVVNWQKIKGWVPDPHGLTEIADRMNKGVPILNQTDHIDAKYYKLENSIPVVRKMLDDRKIKYTPNCTGLREETMSYAKRKLPDGTFSDDPEKKFDHGPDALRYGVLQLFPPVEMGSYGEDEPMSLSVDNVPYTAGIMEKSF